MRLAAAREASPAPAFVHGPTTSFTTSKRKLTCSSRPRGVPLTFTKRTFCVALEDSTPLTKSEQETEIPGSNTAESSGLSDAVTADADDSSREQLSPPAGSWYTVVERVGREDKDAPGFSQESQSAESEDEALDLMKLDDAGRQVLTRASYETIVDVDIEEGGVLDDDDDNNDFHCGVELDALIERDTLVENLRNDFRIETATHVQLAAVPRVLDGRDLVIQSHTGTGKTLAFLLPILDGIDDQRDTTQAVIVTPTRELAMQISRECDRLIAGTGIRNLPLIGGANPARQVEKLRRKSPHVTVGTPGRLAELYENGELRMRGVKWLVVDEVDQCMGEAFYETVVRLLKAVPRTQRILVSATSDVDSVRQFAGAHLHRPVLLRVGGSQRIPKSISHYYCVVPARLRIEVMKKLMYTSPIPNRAIAFVDDPRRVDIVVERLYRMGFVAGALRGNAYKLERAEVLSAFRKGRINLLVTTEVAARGLDVPEISHVFNLDLPTDGDHYLHRGGRCGRAGGVGTVVSIVTSDNAFVVTKLAKELGIEIMRMEPRQGKYSEPMDRRSQGGRPPPEVRGKDRSAGAAVGRQRKESTVEEKTADRISEGSMEMLGEALHRNDTKFIEDSFLKQAKGRIEAGDLDEQGGASPSKMKRKQKLRASIKTKAKAKAKAKAKVKAKVKKSSKISKDGDDDGDGKKEGFVTAVTTEPGMSDRGPATKQDRRSIRRRQKNIGERAAFEGWVGNRSHLDKED